LLTEFQFYRNYPEKQLVVIGQIYGHLIKKRTIDGLTGKVGLQFIVDSMKKSEKLSVLGLTA